MRRSKTISKQQLEPKNLNYDFLYHNAIEFIQQISGGIWTDFNLHDPGVTILEYLCFGITDLGYRTQLDVQDILYASVKGEFEQIQDTLFSPSEIFPSAPITITDYRKLLLDNFPDLQNCWFEREDPISGQKGLYKVYLKVSEWLDPKERDKLKRKAIELLYDNRNLGEDFSSITILEKEELSVSAKVVIHYTADPEEVLVNILLALEKFLSTAVKRYALEELRKEGMPIEEILNGPFMKNGFIKSEELKPKHKSIHTDQLREEILGVSGVIEVSNAYIRKEDLLLGDEVVYFDENRHPSLDKSFLNIPGKKIPLQIEKEGLRIPIDLLQVKRLFDSQLSKQSKSFSKNITSRIETRLSTKTLGDIAFYSSIQRFFPHIYGITPWGVPFRTPNPQKGKARQLKGYLMLFEHFFSTYLAELSSLRYLFSIEKKARINPFNYFPFDIPDVDILLKTTGGNRDSRKEIEVNLRKMFLGINKPLEKRNAILNHLLARFNEEFPDQYIRSMILGRKASDAHLEHLISAKTTFLANYPILSRERGLSFNITKKAWLKDNVSGLKKKISALLGIEDYRNRQLTMSIDASSRLRVEKIEKKTPDQTGIPSKQNPAGIPVNELLIYGLEPYAYNIEFQNGTYIVWFRSPQRGIPKPIFYSDTKDKCEEAIQNLITELIDINKHSEGFFIVDHILLRKLGALNWTLQLRSDEDDLLLVSSQNSAYEDLEILSNDILVIGSRSANFDIVPIADETYEIQLNNEFEDTIMKSPDGYEYAEAVEKRDAILDMLTDIKVNNPEEINDRLFIRKVSIGNSSEEIPPDFFNHQLSFIFPNWAKRFFGHRQQGSIRFLIQQNIPAHLKANFYWLSITDMKEFEFCYMNWLNILSDDELEIETRDNAASDLIGFLIRHSEMDDG